MSVSLVKAEVGNTTVSLVKAPETPRAVAARVVRLSRYCIVRVVTRNSTYLVVKREGVATVICPDGTAIPNVNVSLHAGLRLTAVNIHDGRLMLTTTGIRAADVIEN